MSAIEMFRTCKAGRSTGFEYDKYAGFVVSTHTNYVSIRTRALIWWYLVSHNSIQGPGYALSGGSKCDHIMHQISSELLLEAEALLSHPFRYINKERPRWIHRQLVLEHLFLQPSGGSREGVHIRSLMTGLATPNAMLMPLIEWIFQQSLDSFETRFESIHLPRCSKTAPAASSKIKQAVVSPILIELYQNPTMPIIDQHGKAHISQPME